VSLLSPFSSLVMQTPIFLTKLSDESIIFISDVGKKHFHLKKWTAAQIKAELNEVHRYSITLKFLD
jgi:hypothetical protein